MTQIVTEENIKMRKTIQTIVKTILGKYPIGSLHRKNGKLYESKVVGIDLETGTFKMKDIEVTNAETIKSYEELCTFLDKQDDKLKKLLEDSSTEKQ